MRVRVVDPSVTWATTEPDRAHLVLALWSEPPDRILLALTGDEPLPVAVDAGSTSTTDIRIPASWRVWADNDGIQLGPEEWHRPGCWHALAYENSQTRPSGLVLRPKTVRHGGRRGSGANHNRQTVGRLGALVRATCLVSADQLIASDRVATHKDRLSRNSASSSSNEHAAWRAGRS